MKEIETRKKWQPITSPKFRKRLDTDEVQKEREKNKQLFEIQEISPSGQKYSLGYTIEGKKFSIIPLHSSRDPHNFSLFGWQSIILFLKQAFLPDGYPDSVTSGVKEILIFFCSLFFFVFPSVIIISSHCCISNNNRF